MRTELDNMGTLRPPGRARSLAPAVACAAVIALAVGFPTSAVHANSITDFGVTYSLTSTPLNGLTDEFTLTITGINGTLDTENGRAGFSAVAFNQPANYKNNSATTTAPGFTEEDGGLSSGGSGGCNGSGNFFCFQSSTVSGPVLAPNSTLTFVFDVTLNSGTFAGYDPDFKIEWFGTKVGGYDHVSELLAPTDPVPGPIVGAGLPGVISACFGLWAFQRRRRQRLA